ncbi:HdeD family acid-resistance protein [Streptomyces sp. NPDC101158]|uniref:HdeD family acid-resistance protein n=1 Tax=Streptomyces sp. NPDC101158 TaxID=3366117 RepID=UPI00382A12CF
MTTPRDPASGAGPGPGPGPAPGPAAGGADPYGSPDPAEQLARLGRSWTWVLGAAIATLVPGILALVWPDVTLHVLAVLLGLYLLVIGGFRFVAVFGREEAGERVAGLLVALLFVLGGVLCLRNPLQTIAALSLIVGGVWLVSGILGFYAAVATKGMPYRGFAMVVAVLGITAGIVVLALPTESAQVLTRLLGLWLVLLGAAEVVLALAWRSALRRAGIPGRPGPDGPA